MSLRDSSKEIKLRGHEWLEGWCNFIRENILCCTTLHISASNKESRPSRCVIFGKEINDSPDIWGTAHCPSHILSYYHDRFFPQFLSFFNGGQDRGSVFSWFPPEINKVIRDTYLHLFSIPSNPSLHELKSVWQAFGLTPNTTGQTPITTIEFWKERMIIVQLDTNASIPTLIARKGKECFVAMCTSQAIVCCYVQESPELRLNNVTFHIGKTAEYLFESGY